MPLPLEDILQLRDEGHVFYAVLDYDNSLTPQMCLRSKYRAAA